VVSSHLKNISQIGSFSQVRQTQQIFESTTQTGILEIKGIENDDGGLSLTHSCFMTEGT